MSRARSAFYSTAHKRLERPRFRHRTVVNFGDGLATSATRNTSNLAAQHSETLVQYQVRRKRPVFPGGLD